MILMMTNTEIKSLRRGDRVSFRGRVEEVTWAGDDGDGFKVFIWGDGMGWSVFEIQRSGGMTRC